MKLELSIAADVALVVRVPHPIRAGSPAPSRAVTALTPVRDQGSCAPTRAHPPPSRMRCLARSRTVAGTSSSIVLASQHERRPVGPAGSVGWPAARIDVIGVLVLTEFFVLAVMVFPFLPCVRSVNVTIPHAALISPINFLMCLIQILNGWRDQSGARDRRGGLGGAARAARGRTTGGAGGIAATKYSPPRTSESVAARNIGSAPMAGRTHRQDRPNHPITAWRGTRPTAPQRLRARIRALLDAAGGPSEAAHLRQLRAEPISHKLSDAVGVSHRGGRLDPALDLHTQCSPGPSGASMCVLYAFGFGSGGFGGAHDSGVDAVE